MTSGIQQYLAPLNRTSVGLKPKANVLRLINAKNVESNQCGIETQPLQLIRGGVLFVESNQCGIETSPSSPRLPRGPALNRTSVGLKPHIGFGFNQRHV